MARPLTLLLLAALASASIACGDEGMRVPTWHHGYGGGTATGSQGSSGSGGATSSGGSSGGNGETSSGGSSGTSSGAMSGGSSSGAPMPTATFDVTLAKPSLSVELMTTVSMEVSVAPNGYMGTVQLAPGGLPSGVTAKIQPATLTLDGTTTATATLDLTTDSSAPPGTANVEVSATAPPGSKSATVSLDVQSVITLHIPQGVDMNGGTLANPVTDAYGPYPIPVTAPQGISGAHPVTVYFYNDDDVSHEIHADAPSQGFGHDPGSFGPHSMDPYVRQVNSPGQYDFYLHDQGGPITIGRVLIQ